MSDNKKTKARGYGGKHQQLRKRWARQVAAGGVACARCGLPILDGEAWDLDHSPDRRSYLGPSHASCNGRHGADVRNGVARAANQLTSEERYALGLCSRVW